MDKLAEEETEQRLGLLLKKFVLFFGLLVCLLAGTIVVTVLFWSPFSKNLAARQLKQKQDLNYIEKVCDQPRSGGDIGYGDNDRCDEARRSILRAPWKSAIIDTADAWNLCQGGGCAEIFFYIKLGFGIAAFFLILLALKLSNLAVNRTVENLWQTHTLPSVCPTSNFDYASKCASVGSSSCMYGRPVSSSSSSLWGSIHGKTE
jgi:hypothetical protein